MRRRTQGGHKAGSGAGGEGAGLPDAEAPPPSPPPTTTGRRERSKVPYIVRQCVEEIERRGMEEVGIYRVSGVATDIQALKAAFDVSECLSGWAWCVRRWGGRFGRSRFLTRPDHPRGSGQVRPGASVGWPLLSPRGSAAPRPAPCVGVTKPRGRRVWCQEAGVTAPIARYGGRPQGCPRWISPAAGGLQPWTVWRRVGVTATVVTAAG